MFLLLYAVERNLICMLTRGNTQQIFDEWKECPKHKGAPRRKLILPGVGAESWKQTPGPPQVFPRLSTRMTQVSGQFLLLPLFLPTRDFPFIVPSISYFIFWGILPHQDYLLWRIQFSARESTIHCCWRGDFTTRYQGDAAWRTPKTIRRGTSNRLRKWNRPFCHVFALQVSTWVAQREKPGFGIRQPWTWAVIQSISSMALAKSCPWAPPSTK